MQHIIAYSNIHLVEKLVAYFDIMAIMAYSIFIVTLTFDVILTHLVKVLILLMGMMLNLDCTGSLSQTILSPCSSLLV